MPSFLSDGVEIAYEVYGEGPPLILVHGFASNGEVNWLATGWVETLVAAGYQAVTVDNRGHGKSQKLYDPSLYSAKQMAGDVVNLLDHLKIETVALVGYSMGARISAFVCLQAPARIKAVVFGGLGINIVRGLNNGEDIIAGLLAPSLDKVTTKVGRQFRIFAEHTKSDLRALAACMTPSRDRISEDDMHSIAAPALVVVGSEDTVAGDPAALADLLPAGELLVVERRDHMRTTGDKTFKQGALAFLARHYASV